MSYGFRQGIKNMVRHRGHTIASVCTMTACIGLFCLAFMLVANISNMVKTAEDTVGVTVFFNEGTTEERIGEISDEVNALDYVDESRTVYTSAEQAWEDMQSKYFADSPELAEGFSDNPLANSASLEFHPYDLEDQQKLVDYVNGISDVRRVNSSEVTAASMISLNRIVLIIAAVVIIVLIVVSAFLISNTIAMSIENRKEEIHIMRYIGATKSFARRPFVIEGLITGIIGALIPLIITFVLYTFVAGYMAEHFTMLSSMFVLLPKTRVFAVLIPASAVIGIGIGLVGSEMSVRRYLKV